MIRPHDKKEGAICVEKAVEKSIFMHRAASGEGAKIKIVCYD